MKHEMSNYNAVYLQQAHNSIACKDKTCDKLRDNAMRDKILNGTLRREEYDDERVYCLLKLLQ